MSEEVRQDGSDSVQEQREKNADYKPGGVTGKGWVPGQSGNPSGRPKGRTLMSVIREVLSKPNGDDEALRHSAQAFIDKMCQGSFAHLKEYIDREEGKVPDKLQVEAEVNGSVEVALSPDWFKAPPDDSKTE